MFLQDSRLVFGNCLSKTLVPPCTDLPHAPPLAMVGSQRCYQLAQLLVKKSDGCVELVYIEGNRKSSLTVIPILIISPARFFPFSFLCTVSQMDMWNIFLSLSSLECWLRKIKKWCVSLCGHNFIHRAYCWQSSILSWMKPVGCSHQDILTADPQL